MLFLTSPGCINWLFLIYLYCPPSILQWQISSAYILRSHSRGFSHFSKRSKYFTRKNVNTGCFKTMSKQPLVLRVLFPTQTCWLFLLCASRSLVSWWPVCTASTPSWRCGGGAAATVARGWPRPASTCERARRPAERWRHDPTWREHRLNQRTDWGEPGWWLRGTSAVDGERGHHAATHTALNFITAARPSQASHPAHTTVWQGLLITPPLLSWQHLALNCSITEWAYTP